MGKITTLQESLRNPDMSLRVQVDPENTPGAAIGGGLDALAEASNRAGQLAAQRDLAQQQAVRAQQLSDARIGALSDLADLRIKYSSDSDPATMQQRWQTESDAVLKKYTDQLGNDPGLSQAFAGDFAGWQLRDKIDVATDATRKIADQGRAKLDTGLNTLGSLLGQTSDPVRVQQLKQTAAANIQGAVQAGYLSAEDGGQKTQDFLRTADRAKALTQIDQDPQAALTSLQDGKSYPDLAPTDRPTLVNQAQAEIKRQEAEAKAAAAEARQQRQTDVALRFDDAIANASVSGRQTVLGNDEILAAFPGRQGQQMVDRLNEATQEGTDRITVSTQSLQEDQDMLAKLQPQPGVETTADEVKRYQSLADVVEQKRQAVATDPAAYVMANNQAVKDAWSAVAASNNDPGAVKKALAATREAQLDIGVPADKLRVMPVAQASAIADQINSLKPTDRGQAVQNAMATYGLAGVKEIEAAGAPRTTRALVTVDNPVWQNDLGRAESVGKDLDSLVKGRGVKTSDLDNAVDTAFQPFASTLPAASVAPYADAIKQVARMKVADGLSMDDAVNAAIKPFSDSFAVQDGYRVPVQFNADKVSAGLQAVSRSLTKFDIAPPGSADPHLDEAYRAKETLASLSAGHYRWVTNQLGDGVIMTYEDGQPVMRKSGAPMELLFKDLVAGKYGIAIPGRGRVWGQTLGGQP